VILFAPWTRELVKKTKLYTHATQSSRNSSAEEAENAKKTLRSRNSAAAEYETVPRCGGI
jgi:hypothetical protein